MIRTRNAFTLIEIIGAIVILVIIGLVTVSYIADSINESKSKMYDEQVDRIEKAARTWGMNNLSLLPNSNSFSKTRVYITTLITEGLINDSASINPLTDEIMQGCVVISHSSDYGQYEYIYDETCAVDTLVDTSGANAPKIYEDMVPIAYVGSKWVVATSYNDGENQNWYDYTNKKWANVALVKADSLTDYFTNNDFIAGTEIDETDVLAYLVWIPRFSYTIKGTYGNGGTSTTVIGSIDIKFVNTSDIEELGSATYSSGAATNYRTHPAFNFDDKQLSGIWVGKFETSGTIVSPTVKPNLVALINQDVSTEFETSQVFNTFGIGELNNAHVMRSSEWGAVAYLTQSIYGKCTSATSCTELYINNSSSYYTGRSGGTTSAAASPNGTYSYDGRTCSTASCTSEAIAGDPTLGTRASTTSNIYGVYDMSGGAWEYVMGAYSNAANNNGYPAYSGYSAANNSGYNGWLGFDSALKTNGKAWISSKYYELFTSTTSSIACNTGKCYGHGLSETTDWYSDASGFVSATYPWLLKGGTCTDGASAGLYSSSSLGNGAANNYSFHIALSSTD